MNNVKVETVFKGKYTTLAKITMYRGTSNDDTLAGLSYWTTDKQEALRYYRGTLLQREFYFSFGVLGNIDFPNQFHYGSSRGELVEVESDYKFGIENPSYGLDTEFGRVNIHDAQMNHFFMSAHEQHLNEITARILSNETFTNKELVGIS